jgi:hypothetical protein
MPSGARYASPRLLQKNSSSDRSSIRLRNGVIRDVRLNPDSEAQSNTQRKPRKKAHGEHREKKLFSVFSVRFFRGCKRAKIEPQLHPLNRLYPVGYDCIINTTWESRLKK